MRRQYKLVLIGLAAILGILWFITNHNAPNPNVQDIVPAEVDPPDWFLSPSGDKLLYNIRGVSGDAFIRFLATGRDMTITDCPQFRWLDDETVYCYDYQKERDIPSSVIGNISTDTGAFSKILIKILATDQVELGALLEQPNIIYRIQYPAPQYGTDSLLILDIEDGGQYYHLTGIKNLDKVLKSYNYIPIPLETGGVSLKKEYSPNRAYYFLLQDDLGIYDVTNDRLLTKIKLPTDQGTFIQIGGSYPNQSGGWAADSSGVYFRIYHTFRLPPRPLVWPIQKLCVPGAASCSTGK